jgi:hypothetical protein
MPPYGVTVTATFRNPDREAVDAAKSLIENMANRTVAQSVANTQSAVKTWLAQQINALSGMSATGITVTAANITLSGFTAAVTGGANGSFTFTVSLSKGAATAVTAGRSGTITATPLVHAQTPVISSHPQSRSVTEGSSVTLSVTASVSDGGVLSYRWYRNTANSNTGGTAISGATSASYSPSTAATGTYYYYVVVTNTNNSVNGTKTATATGNTAMVTVNALVNAAAPVIISQPQGATVNVGGSVTLSVTVSVSDGGTLSYRWYRNTTNSNSGGTLISGATGSSYSPSTATAGTTYYYVAVTNTNSSVNGTKTATATSNTATVTVSIPVYAISIAATSNGSVSADRSTAQAGATVTLTVTPAAGYEPDAITVFRTGAESTRVETRCIASLQTYTFTMPAYGVTVRATFRKTQAQLDREAVEAAKAAIEGGTYRVAQATANDAASVKTWLIHTLNVLFGQSFNIQVRSTAANPIDAEVAVKALTPAIAGTETTPAGINGSFRFTVTLTRGQATVTTAETPGVIVATPYAVTPVKRIELLPLGGTTVRILNTGNVETGDLTLTLTGVHAGSFTFSPASPGSLPAGGEADIILTPDAILTPGAYTLTLTVSADGLTPVSVEITYTVMPVGTESIETPALRAIVTGEGLRITGLIPGEMLSVYSIQGQLIYRRDAMHGVSTEQRVPLRVRGLYIVVSGERTVKVIY